jgi:predicted transposase YdaD
VLRLWQQPRELFLTGGLALLPLAPLCQLPADVPLEQALREVIHQVDQRLSSEAPHARAVQLMTAAFVLTGLRVDRHMLAEIFRGVKVMHESSAFTLYEEKGRQEGRQEGRHERLQEGRKESRKEGRLEESHRLLLRLGQNRFGPVDATIEATLGAITDLDQLERMVDAVLNATSWQDLLATP